MNLEQHPKLQEVLETGYEFKLGDYISTGIDIFKKNIGVFVGYTAVFFLIVMVGSFIPFLGSIGLLVVTYPLLVGFYLGAHKLHKNETLEFRDFFKGFDYIGQLLLMYLVTVLIVSIFLIPFFVSFFISITSLDSSDVLLDDNPFAVFSIFPFWTFIFFLPMIYLGIAWMWAPFLIVFHKLSFWDAMMTSMKIVNKKFLMTLVFAIIVGMISSIGMVALFVGILLSYPAALCMQYAAFADITQLLKSEGEAQSDIVDHLVA